MDLFGIINQENLNLHDFIPVYSYAFLVSSLFLFSWYLAIKFVNYLFNKFFS